MLGYHTNPPWKETPPSGSRHPTRSRHPPGSRHPQPPRADTPLEADTPQKKTPPREADSDIRSMSGRYASYWNAFLLLHIIITRHKFENHSKCTLHQYIQKFDFFEQKCIPEMLFFYTP